MTHPSIHARTMPNKIAYQMAGTGKAITYPGRSWFCPPSAGTGSTASRIGPAPASAPGSKPRSAGSGPTGLISSTFTPARRRYPRPLHQLHELSY